MGVPAGILPLPLGLLALLALPGAAPLAVEDSFVELDFFQESFPSQKQSGEFLEQHNQEEVFHVDWAGKETVWRLPDFTSFASFDAQGALGNLAVLKNNLEIMMKRSNRSQSQKVAPSVTMYLKNPVELGDPNVLICFVDQFFPPVLNITWLKNGEVVSQGVQETDFYPKADSTFRKFSYLRFIPKAGDFYACKVDHWGLTESLSKVWYSKEPTPIPETLENVICALGLALGILGIIAGTILCFKARQGDEDGRRWGAR
ncbi:HLA class II histocompatibility antigen, DR alpha chain-like [Tiliqua scincoides]|uniref:HLA class II histocompatibility antigen, DR alpha chain-like n=1 Tax=Tiliqua scincoides TaxID=71010 RepID=UPI003462C6AB